MDAFIARDTKAETTTEVESRRVEPSGCEPVTRRSVARLDAERRLVERRARRSSHRSSTSSMPTDSRTSPSGMVAASVFQRRRRSKVDSTPPSDVACTQSFVLRVSRSAAIAPWASTIETIAAEPGVADLADAGCSGRRRTSSWALAWARSTRRCRVRRPRSASQASSGAGDGADQVAAVLEHGVELVVAGDDRAEQDVAVPGEVLRRGVHDQVDAELERRCSRGVAKVLSTTT